MFKQLPVSFVKILTHFLYIFLRCYKCIFYSNRNVIANLSTGFTRRFGVILLHKILFCVIRVQNLIFSDEEISRFLKEAESSIPLHLLSLYACQRLHCGEGANCRRRRGCIFVVAGRGGWWKSRGVRIAGVEKVPRSAVLWVVQLHHAP